MRDHLVITLAAPLVSHGDLAGHERRGGAAWPGRSAVLGLVGAALGLRRSDAEGQRALNEGYGVAVLVHRPGEILRDYHTAQTVPSAKVKRPATRADALQRGRAAGALNTVISIREYRMDALFKACLYVRGTPHWSLEGLRQALLRPRFAVYLGRKSCPLAAPMNPRIVRANDAHDALLPADPEAEERPGIASDTDPETLIVDPDGLAEVPAAARRERRWDVPGDRRGWHFAPREAIVIPLRTAQADGA